MNQFNEGFCAIGKKNFHFNAKFADLSIRTKKPFRIEEEIFLSTLRKSNKQ